MNKKIKDYLNKKYNRLTFIQQIDGGNPPKGLFKCDCGIEKIINCYAVFKGFTKSCGCWKKERQHCLNEKHKLSRHPLYDKWHDMKLRCYKETATMYSRYGGRGIKICDEWKDDMKTFVKWGLENGWFEGSHIDRINGDGDYEPTNCRFVTAKVNNLNRSVVRFFEYKGELNTIPDWAIRFGLSKDLLQKRIKRGWNIAQAIELPIGTFLMKCAQKTIKNRTMFLEEFI